MKYPVILLLGFYFIGFSCHSIEKLDTEKPPDAIVENEIWQPLIILTRKEKKMINEFIYNKPGPPAGPERKF